MSREARILCKMLATSDVKIRRICEVGTLEGASATRMADRFPRAEMLLIDNWRPYAKDRPRPPAGRANWDKHRLRTPEELNEMCERVHARVRKYGKRVQILRADSQDAVKLLGDSIFDVVFIDADHRYDTVKADLDGYWRTLRSGGIFCGHDYESSAERRGDYWGVKRAVNEFAEKHHLELVVTDKEGIWWMIKP